MQILLRETILHNSIDSKLGQVDLRMI